MPFPLKAPAVLFLTGLYFSLARSASLLRANLASVGVLRIVFSFQQGIKRTKGKTAGMKLADQPALEPARLYLFKAEMIYKQTRCTVLCNGLLKSGRPVEMRAAPGPQGYPLSFTVPHESSALVHCPSSLHFHIRNGVVMASFPCSFL